MPPAVGNAETSSDMHSPMIRMNAEMTGQPMEMAIGPPLFQAWPKVVKQPARIEMIENEMAKFENPLQLAVELLLVAELGQSSFVVVEQGVGHVRLRARREGVVRPRLEGL